MQLSPSREDYLKAVIILSSQEEFVRIKDLADYLSVKPPSAVAAIKELTQAGLVHHEPYGSVELTAQGLEIAKEIQSRHKVLVEFLSRFLGLDKEAAEGNACRVEHSLDPQALGQIVKFLQFLEACPANAPRCLAAFRHYAATNTLPDSCPRMGEGGTPSAKWCYLGTSVEPSEVL
jgi:DtxR family Mn-dependent transcriptional regulator